MAKNKVIFGSQTIIDLTDASLGQNDVAKILSGESAYGKDGEKITFVCAANKASIAKGLKAGDLVRKAAEITGGKGGGRPDMAQAGGKNPAGIENALKKAEEVLDSQTA